MWKGLYRQTIYKGQIQVEYIIFYMLISKINILITYYGLTKLIPEKLRLKFSRKDMDEFSSNMVWLMTRSWWPGKLKFWKIFRMSFPGFANKGYTVFPSNKENFKLLTLRNYLPKLFFSGRLLMIGCLLKRYILFAVSCCMSYAHYIMRNFWCSVHFKRIKDSGFIIRY